MKITQDQLNHQLWNYPASAIHNNVLCTLNKDIYEILDVECGVKIMNYMLLRTDRILRSQVSDMIKESLMNL